MLNIKITLGQLIVMMVFMTSYHTAQAQCASAANIYSFTYNGKNYEVVRQNTTWINAASCAVTRGGYLAEINNASEQTAIYNELQKFMAKR